MLDRWGVCVYSPYEYFLSLGYSFLGEGFSHYTFIKDEKVYKFSKTIDSTVNTLQAYENEIYYMRLLYSYGFPCVKPLKIFAPGELLPQVWVLQEEKAKGISYKQNTIPDKAEVNIFNFIFGAYKIHDHWFGSNGEYNSIRKSTWSDYLICQYNKTYNSILPYKPIDMLRMSLMIKEHIRYCGPPALLIMDSNVENYFFDDSLSICSIIDVDHPIFGDPLYQCVSIRWHRQHRFDRFIENSLKRCNLKTQYVYLYLIAADDLSFRLTNNIPVSPVIDDFAQILDILSSL